MPTRVLFMCPHAAGKSLLAATYFRAAAARAGLEVAIDVAGPDPYAHNVPEVEQALEAQGYTIGWQPRLVTAADTESADIVVSVGCARDSVPTDKPVVDWEVPLLDDDPEGSMRAIFACAEALAIELAGED